MGLMRALTLKRSAFPSRHNTLKGRPQISLPTELISTTNTLSYTAPSVESMQQKAASATSIYASETDSEIASSAASLTDRPSTPTTTSEPNFSRRSSNLSDSPSLTDASSVTSSPVTPPTHHDFAITPLSATSGYFRTDPFSKTSSRTSLVSVLDDEHVDPFTVVVPALPRRAPSHSKREHERLARRRSQRVSMKIDAAAAQAYEDFAPLTAAMPELVEVAEEEMPTVTVVEVAETEEEIMDRLMRELVVKDEEAAYMRQHNLKKFSVSGYLDVVGEMWGMESYVVDDVVVVA